MDKINSEKQTLKPLVGAKVTHMDQTDARLNIGIKQHFQNTFCSFIKPHTQLLGSLFFRSTFFPQLKSCFIIILVAFRCYIFSLDVVTQTFTAFATSCF